MGTARGLSSNACVSDQPREAAPAAVRRPGGHIGAPSPCSGIPGACRGRLAGQTGMSSSADAWQIVGNHVFPRSSRRSFSSVYLRNTRKSAPSGPECEVSTSPVRRSVRRQRKDLPFCSVPFASGSEYRQGDDLAGVACAQGCRSCPEGRRQISNRSAFVGRIEDQVALAVFSLSRSP